MMNQLNWLTKKPTLNFECVLITAQWYNEVWHYRLWEVVWIEDSWALCCDDGEEWGEIEDLKADKYALIQPLKKE